MRGRFAAAAHDLSLALSGLGAMRSVAPPDVAEDVEGVQRQLAALRFCSGSGGEQLVAAQLLQVGGGGLGCMWVGVHRGTRAAGRPGDLPLHCPELRSPPSMVTPATTGRDAAVPAPARRLRRGAAAARGAGTGRAGPRPRSPGRLARL